jgi:uncharacterized damage-inducible protein DinB
MELPEATRIRLTSQYELIEGMIANLSKEQLNEVVFEGKWTVHQQLAHLVRYQEMFFERLQTIMNSFNAVFVPYVAEEDDEFFETAKLPVHELLRRLKEMRETLNNFYFGLNSGELIRKGKHMQLGNFSIALWAEFFLLHEAHHIYCIFLMSNKLTNAGSSDSEAV